MTQIRIKLRAHHFRTLVSGGEVTFDESDITRSKAITLQPSMGDGVVIILEDIGWDVMTAIIERERTDPAIEARNLKILNDDSVWNQDDQPPERKPSG